MIKEPSSNSGLPPLEELQRQLDAANAAAPKSAEKPLKIKTGFDAAMKKIAKAPKPKSQK